MSETKQAALIAFDELPDDRRSSLARQLGLPTKGLTQFELRTVAETQHTHKLKGPTYLGMIYEREWAERITNSVNASSKVEELLQIISHRDYISEHYTILMRKAREVEAALKGEA